MAEGQGAEGQGAEGQGAVEVRHDVVFGRGGGRDLKCDIYSPANLSAPAPVILLLHGGGWREGNRSVMSGFGTELARAGIVGVASEYRLTPESPWPAQIHDTKTAIRWIRANAAELGVDDRRLAVLGRSAGGHLALLAAGTPGVEEFEGDGGHAGVATDVAATIGIFPPTWFYTGDERGHGGTQAAVLLLDATTPEAAHAASPLSYVGDGYPPTFLLHGTGDKVVPPSASMLMYEALVAARVPVELHMYAGEPHGFAGQPEFTPLCAAEIAHFLGRCFSAVAASSVSA